MAVKARGQITIVDLNDGRSLNLFLSSNQALTQIYDSDTADHFTPNYTTSPLVITPQLFVSGVDSDVISQCTKGVWTINGSTNIAEYGGSQAATSPYALTINKNMDVAQMRIEYQTIYSENGLDTTVKAQINLVKVNNAGNSIVAVMYAPEGTVICRNTKEADQMLMVRLHCDMWRGSVIDDTDVTYQWKKMNDVGRFEDIFDVENVYDGVKTNDLKVFANGVDNYEIFKCEIVDKDTASSTYDKKVEATETVTDITDPYSVEIVSTSGNILNRGVDGTTLTANIWQNAELFPDSSAIYTNATYSWVKYDKNGQNGTEVGTSRTLYVGKDSINVRATFICTVTI